MEKEQFKPEYLAINPTHTIPALVDDGLSMWDSHVINPYLVSKYGKDDSLYPSYLKLRTVVNQRLHFSNGELYPRASAFFKSVFVDNKPEFDAEAAKDVDEAFTYLETFLGDNLYLAGNQLTVADFCASVVVVALLYGTNEFDPTKYSKIVAWIKRLEQLPYYHDATGQYYSTSENMIKEKLEANRAAVLKAPTEN